MPFRSQLNIPYNKLLVIEEITNFNLNLSTTTDYKIIYGLVVEMLPLQQNKRKKTEKKPAK